MKRAILDHRKDFVAILGLVLIATAVAGYVLENQRLRFPFIEDKPFILKAEFETAQAVTPGQGQTVRVSGIRVGDIGKVELRKTGRAVITMELDKKYERLVHTDASAFLRPKTGLKDMFIELNPGRHELPVAKAGWVMPIRSTLPDVNPDEFLSALDDDTRDYLKLLLNGAARGLKGRGNDLREVLARFEPTYRDIAAVTTQVALRRRELRRLINSLNQLNGELASKDDDLAELIKTSSVVFRAFASESANVSGTIRELPTALIQTRRTLAKVDTMARLLGPTSTKLIPVAGALTRANVATIPFARETAPLLRNDIRPFVRAARPVVRNLQPAAADLVKAEPYLTRSFVVLNHLFNMLGYNRGGREGPDDPNRDEGYLFYLGWVAHQSVNIFSSSDAHGPGRTLTAGGNCGIIRGTSQSIPGGEFLLGTAGVLTDPRVCGAGQP